MSQTTSTDALSRNQFLRQLGFQGAALLTVYCAGQTLTSCSKGAGITPAPLTGVVTVDLTSSANAALLKQGGYIITNSLVVANTSKGYVAVTVVCSHEGQRQVQLRSDQFYCSAHGALYDLSGKGLNSLGNSGLTVYTIKQSGNTLTISQRKSQPVIRSHRYGDSSPAALQNDFYPACFLETKRFIARDERSAINPGGSHSGIGHSPKNADWTNDGRRFVAITCLYSINSFPQTDSRQDKVDNDVHHASPYAHLGWRKSRC